VLIEGRLRMDTWDDKETGQKRSRLKVVCENMQMLGSRGEGGGRGGSGGGGARASADISSYASEPPPDAGYDASSGPPTDEVPF
jgi:single-strand DNA-binding protein